MEIDELQAFDFPNIYSLREPIVKLQVKLGELVDVPTKNIGDLNDRIIELFPGLKDHKCSTGYVGGFVDRLKEGTYLAHVMEHLCLETQRILGYDIKYGKARQVEKDVYNIIFACTHPLIGKACGNFVLDTINALLAGKAVDIKSELSKLKKICNKYETDEGIKAIISEAGKRGIPCNVVNDGEMVKLGYGKYQKDISPAHYDSTSSISDNGAIDGGNSAPEELRSPNLGKLFGQGEPFTIPIVSITGTNGKTTTTRMISGILRQQGLTVGTTTSQGIYINDTCIEAGDTTGPKSAKTILNNRNVEAAVLETARGGIVRRGLAYEKADVAVFTNLTGDHIGMDGINTMEELLHAKSLVIEAVKDNGVCVLNADDPWVMSVREKAKGEQILFSLNDKNPLLQEHMDKGGTAVYRKNHEVYITSNGVVRKYISLGDISSTLDGRLMHNIYNSMAAIGACFALGVSFNFTEQALKEFTCDAGSNPGRFNIYDLGEFKVVLDFGHNLDGYRVTIDGLKALNAKRLVGIIRAPGDRPDTDIISVGKISGRSFDDILVREDKDLRGRQPLEVARLLHHGALSGGISKEHIKIIPDEEEALKIALKEAQNGDIIIVFFEKMEPLMQIIKEYKNDIYRENSMSQLVPHLLPV